MAAKTRYRILYAAALILLLPALLIHLGLLTFIDDEGIRALVALEMKLSGNYIVPTLHGAFYYNKPPLFNWYLLLFFQLAGNFSEFTARSATVVSLLGYAATLYYFFRQEWGPRLGFLVAFLTITCGRILFWDSMLALIDITFSWVVFTSFMVIYRGVVQQRWGWLFAVSYALTAVGFLMKGLPAIVFQGVTLVVYLTLKGQFRRLFSLAHIGGGLLFLLIIGIYYGFYFQYNDLATVFQTLYAESSKRTVISNGVGKTVLHLFSFPLEMTYHFLPWSLLIVYVFIPRTWALLRQQPLLFFLGVTFLANVLIYWSSPGVHPRYLLMLAPLLFAIFLYLHQLYGEQRHGMFRVLEGLFMGICFLLAGLSFSPLFLEQTQGVSHLWWKTASVALPAVGLAVAYYYWAEQRLEILVVFLLVLRLGFDWFVLPDRNANDFGDVVRKTSSEVGVSLRDQPLVVYGDAEMQPANSFYLTRARGAIIPRDSTTHSASTLYIIDVANQPIAHDTVATFWVRHQRRLYHVGHPQEKPLK